MTPLVSSLYSRERWPRRFLLSYPSFPLSVRIPILNQSIRGQGTAIVPNGHRGHGGEPGQLLHLASRAVRELRDWGARCEMRASRQAQALCIPMALVYIVNKLLGLIIIRFVVLTLDLRPNHSPTTSEAFFVLFCLCNEKKACSICTMIEDHRPRKADKFSFAPRHFSGFHV